MHLALLIGKTYSFYRPEAKLCSVGGRTRSEVLQWGPGRVWGTPHTALGSRKSTDHPLGVFSSLVMAFGCVCPFLWQVEGLSPGRGRRWGVRLDRVGAAAPFSRSPFPVAPDAAGGEVGSRAGKVRAEV